MAHGKNGQYWHTMNKAQQVSCYRKFEQEQPRVGSDTLKIGRNRESYLSFRRRFRLHDYFGGSDKGAYFGGPWCGMFIGIEYDGYTHS